MDPNAPQPSVTVTPPPIVPAQPMQNNGRKKLILAIGICVFLTVGMLVTFLILTQKKEAPKKDMTPTPTVVKPSVHDVTLLKITPVQIPDTDITLLYAQSIDPMEGCPEYSSSTEIKITQGKNEETLIYSCGGIVGACIDSQEKFGYKVTILEKINEMTLKVRIAKK